MAIERAYFSGGIVETKQMEVNGVPVGVLLGHIATWTKDTFPGVFGIPDQVVRGAYTKSIQEHKARKQRQIRLKDHHGRTVGGFPIGKARQDNIGLFAEGHVNLETQQGREAYSLARQGVLVDWSIGQVVKEDKIEDGTRVIMEAEIIEASIVDEPKNRRSNITEVKYVSFADLPIASGQSEWDEDLARERVMELKFADGNGADAFIGDHLIADVVDGKLLVIPAALRIAAEEIKSSNNISLQVPIERYYAKMEETTPFDTKLFYSVDDVRTWTNAEFKDALASTGRFSNGAIRSLVARGRDQIENEIDLQRGHLESLIAKMKAS